MLKRAFFWALGVVFLVPSTLLALVYWLLPVRIFRWLPGRWVQGGAKQQALPEPTTRLRQNVQVEFSIPAAVVGYVVGRRGVRVRQVESESGARVQFKDKMATADKVVVISGRPECVKAAQSAIQQAMQERAAMDEEAVDASEGGAMSVSVPAFAVGRIIGRQGANIRSIQRVSGARVSMTGGPEDAAAERVCILRGSPSQMECARRLVQESVEQSQLVRKQKPRAGRLHSSLHGVGGQEQQQQHRELAPCKLPAGREFFPSFVSAVDGSGGVWVQPLQTNDASLLEMLVDDMTACYSSPHTGSTGDLFAEGCVCAAPFEHDSRWYRARVVSLLAPGGERAEVLYLDYGDYGTVPVTQLKSLLPEYYDLPIQSVCCSLAGVAPLGGTWSEEALQCLDELTLCATWRVVMVMTYGVSEQGPSVVIVDTSTEQDVDVAERLVALGHTHFVGTHSVRLRKDCSLLVAPPTGGHVTLPPPGEEFQATITAVESPTLMYLQPGKHRPRVEQLSVALGKTVPSSPLLPQLQLAQLVAACPEGSDVWYRAQVLEVAAAAAEGSALLRLLDYGTCYNVPLSFTRPLPKELMSENAYAVPCSLAGVLAPEESWSTEAMQLLRGLLEQQGALSVEVASHASGLPSVLLSLGGEGSVSSQLLTRGLAVPSGRLSPEGMEEEEGQGDQRNVSFQWANAKHVSIAGSFSNWQPVEMKQRQCGEFECEVEVPEGSHQYKYLVDGEWCHDNTKPTSCNAFGTLNNVLDL